MLKTWLLTGVVIGLTFTQTSRAQAPLSFNGLNGESTRRSVLKIFPSAMIQNFCKPGQTLARNADGLTLCEQLTIPTYYVG